MSHYHEIDDDDDDPEILQDGQSVRVRLDMMDSMSDVQRAVALSTMRLCDGLGRPAGCRPGFVFADTDPVSKANWERQRIYDEQKAELSARWKGGLQQGDQVTICGHRLIIVGRDAAGKYQVRDSGFLSDAETIKTQAYDAYEHWLTTASQGSEQDQSEYLPQEPRSSPPHSAVDAGRIKDEANAEYEESLTSVWKHNK